MRARTRSEELITDDSLNLHILRQMLGTEWKQEMRDIRWF